MGTFVEFYTTLLGFVNYRLYTSIRLVYPPRFDTKSDEQGGELGAITLNGQVVEGKGQSKDETVDDPGRENTDVESSDNAIVQSIADGLGQRSEPADETDLGVVQVEPAADTMDEFEVQGEGADVLDQPRISDTEAGSLFAPYSFFLSRETPRQPLEFILRAFGCKRIGWDQVLGDGAFTHDMGDPSITHQVVDRPPLIQPEMLMDGHTAVDTPPTSATTGRIPGRTYIQPQWVWDCINQGRLLRPDQYAPGATMPPHLSPWVKPTKASYDPTIPLADQEDGDEIDEAEETDVEEPQELDSIAGVNGDSTKSISVAEPDELDVHGMDVASASSTDSSEVEDEDEFGGFGSDDPDANEVEEDDDEKTRSQYQKELEAEAAGLTFAESADSNSRSATSADLQRKTARRKRREEEEELERRKMMISKKKRKLFDKMAYSNRAKDEEAAKLRSKRRKLEKAQN